MSVITEINMPELEWSIGKRHMYMRFGTDELQTMDIIKAVVEEIDLNAPWMRRRYDSYQWRLLVAARASLNLRVMDITRRRAGGSYKRHYPEVSVDGNVVNLIVSELTRFYGTKFYYSGDELDFKVECVPNCPSCGKRLKLMWKRWGEPYEDGRTRFNLIWGCPAWEYERCRPGIQKEWGGITPEIVVGTPGKQIYFHDWGEQIPTEYRPHYTMWSKDEGEVTYMLSSEPKRRAVFTDEMVACIKETYPREKAAGFFRRFPKERVFSWYSVQYKAHKLGVAGNGGA